MFILTIRRQLLGTALLSLAGFVLFGVVSYLTLNELKISGPRYKRIAQGKDLIADVVPPPEFLVESFLAVHQMIDESDRRRLEELITQSQQFRTNFEERHDYWARTLREGSLRDAMNIRSYQPAKEFFRVRDEEFIPAVRRGDRETARALANTTLKALFEQHRKAVLQVVHLALIQNSREEESATAIAEQRTTLIPLVGLMIVSITIGIALWLSR
ncbi:MAG TPA: hypothetical protein VER77_04055, partial [Candidatus Dormibacteraeota bacterium]|nr:hypothetical protein [Candidatus Dormibacteraeota bacterium]